jgi:hypothetical protein
MNSERSQAYGRVTATLTDIGPTKLQAAEQDVLRDAADTLLFCEDVSGDPTAQEALERVDDLLERLVASDRWTPERAEDLRRDIAACGPAIAR